MPIFIYDPADTHRNHPLHVPGNPPLIVRAGESFEAGGLSGVERHMARVPGKVLGGVVRPCVVPLVEQGSPAADKAPAVAAVDNDELANAVAALRRQAPDKVTDAVWALDALLTGAEFHINPKSISMVVAEPMVVREAPPVVLDPVALPPPPVADVTLTPRTYTADALADMTRNELLGVAEAAGVEVSARAARVKADIIEVLAEAGLVEGQG